MLKKIILFLFAASLLTLTSFADSYEVKSPEELKKYLSKVQSGDSIYIGKNFTCNESFTIPQKVELTQHPVNPGTLTLSNGAAITNNGKISINSLNLSSGATVNTHGTLELTNVPKGAVINNYATFFSPRQLTLNGTLTIFKGGILTFSHDSIAATNPIVYMGEGARFKGEISKNYTAILPDNSSVRLSGNFDYKVIKTAAPTITFGGTNSQNQRLLNISCTTPNAIIYFTIDGSEPTLSSSVFNGSVYVKQNCTINAVARAVDTILSDVSTASANAAAAPVTEQPAQTEPEQPTTTPEPEQVNPALPNAQTPSITPAAGIYPYRQMIYLNCATNGAKIYYTTDGTTPTTASKLYTAPFDIVSTTVVKAIAVKHGMNSSEVLTSRYTLTGFSASSPNFSNPDQLESFWQPAVQKIAVSAKNEVTVDAKNCPYLSNSVMQALHQKGNVTLIIKRENAADIVIPAQKVLTDYQNDVRVWYSLDVLAKQFAK